MSGPDGPKSGDATPAKPKSAPAQGAAQKSPQEGRPSAPRYTEEMAMDRLIKHVEGKGIMHFFTSVDSHTTDSEVPKSQAYTEAIG